MPITQEKAQLAECDACGSRQWFHEVDDIEGVHGEVMVVHGGGGYSVAFYSCRDDEAHVGLAFTNAQNRSFESAYSPERFSAVTGKDSAAPVLASPKKRPGPRLNPKSDAALLSELVDLQTMLGRTPSLDHTKKTLHIGKRRARDLLDSLSPLPPE
jgi:hypothetical protein